MGCQSSSTVVENEIKGSNPLLEPVKLGSIALKNRVIMGAMTRCRGNAANGVPTDLMVEYYGQRSGFGAIISECSQISLLANGFPGSGGIYTREQVEGWKKVTQRVHQNGGKIILQIWHCGRAALSDFIGGVAPLAPSPIAIRTPHAYTKGPHPVPKEMTKADIRQVLEEFKQGARNAKEAGFDGLELHAGNGYLIDQFLKDGTNKRNDEYGGSIQNRIRFCLEALDALTSVYGSDKVGIKLTPTGRYNDMYDSNPLELTRQLLKELEKKNLAFVEMKRHGFTDSGKSADGKVDEHGQTLPAVQIPNFFDTIRSLYNGTLILNDGIDQATGNDLIKTKKAAAISFASLAIGNPDLPERFRNGWELAQPDYSTLFTPGAKGYTDYPAHR